MLSRKSPSSPKRRSWLSLANLTRMATIPDEKLPLVMQSLEHFGAYLRVNGRNAQPYLELNTASLLIADRSARQRARPGPRFRAATVMERMRKYLCRYV
jgi:hypothetical protein